MNGIGLNGELDYIGASMRIFEEGEKHVNRTCDSEVLLTVFDGVLRFTEDDTEYEVYPGEYFIQRKGGIQRGDKVSDVPKYFYVHFNALWTNTDNENDKDILPKRGKFNRDAVFTVAKNFDIIAHGESSKAELNYRFYELLTTLYRSKNKPVTLADNIAAYLKEEYLNGVSLENISEKFNFSKNHIINIFKREYGLTPFEYINELKIKQAEYLLTVTSDTIESISYKSGFNNYSQFFRLFTEKNGMPPKEWRKRKQY